MFLKRFDRKCRIQLIEREIWQRSAPSFADYNYRQLWDFGTASASRLGAVSEHVGVYQGAELIGLSDVRVKRIPFFNTGIAYINGGPLIKSSSEEDPEIVKVVLSVLVDEYVNRRKLVLRIQPPWEQEPRQSRQSNVYTNLGFIIPKYAKSYRTIVIDLSLPEEVIRKQFDHKWRTNLNNAEKKNLQIQFGYNEELCSAFTGLYEQLRRRKAFKAELQPAFYFSIQKLLPESEKFLVCIAALEGQPISGYVSSLLGNTCVSLLAASNEEGLKNKASNLIQWSMIRKAKERRARFYDLGGIDPDSNPGGYHFKKDMGGIDVTVPGPYEVYPGTWKKNVVSLLEKSYRKYKKIQKSAPLRRIL